MPHITHWFVVWPLQVCGESCLQQPHELSKRWIFDSLRAVLESLQQVQAIQECHFFRVALVANGGLDRDSESEGELLHALIECGEPKAEQSV